MTLTHGSKLEHWQHPEIQDSIEPSALQSASRNPKIFGGTTTTITSTTSILTYCYTSAQAISTACDRKKRAIDERPIEGQENTLALIHPSAIEGIESVESSRKEKSVPLSKLEELN